MPLATWRRSARETRDFAPGMNATFILYSTRSGIKERMNAGRTKKSRKVSSLMNAWKV